MYDPSDPRSTLLATPPAATPDTADGIAAPEYVEFLDEVPASDDATSGRTWISRAQNFALAYSRLRAGQRVARRTQPTEYVLLLPHDTSAVTVVSAGEEREVRGQAVVVVPPGDSEVRALDATDIVRLFDADTLDVLEAASNAASYAHPHPRVAPLVRWPAPVDGDRLRVYPLAEVPVEPGRFGRIFRTRAFMVNVLDPFDGPRSPQKLSPHHHDDFEQCSLAVSGEFEHHIRTPWTTNMDHWRDDEHRRVGSPSIAVIPPPTVHTTRASGSERNQLVDIFSPPRADFSAREGWVLNAAEYPVPEGSRA